MESCLETSTNGEHEAIIEFKQVSKIAPRDARAAAMMLLCIGRAAKIRNHVEQVFLFPLPSLF